MLFRAGFSQEMETRICLLWNFRKHTLVFHCWTSLKWWFKIISKDKSSSKTCRVAYTHVIEVSSSLRVPHSRTQLGQAKCAPKKPVLSTWFPLIFPQKKQSLLVTFIYTFLKAHYNFLIINFFVYFPHFYHIFVNFFSNI